MFLRKGTKIKKESIVHRTSVREITCLSSLVFISLRTEKGRGEVKKNILDLW